MPGPSITDDDVFTGLVAFVNAILPALGAVNVRQGQENRVPMPPGPNFVILTQADRVPLATTTRDYVPASDPAPADGERITTRSTQIGLNIDFFGPGATDNGQVFNTLFRDLYGCEFLAPYNVQPLWCDDGRQLPLLDSEKQYETRWMIHAWLQVNPAVSTTQQFADTVDSNVFEADNPNGS